MKLRTIIFLVILVLLPVDISWALKQCPLHIDKWYRIESDWCIQSPDKFQHSFFSYAGQRLGSEVVGEGTAFIIITTLGILKECLLDNEGYSLRDVGANTWGCVGGILDDHNAICSVQCVWEEGCVMAVVGIKLR